MKYLLKQDRDRVGYTVKEISENEFELFDTKGKSIKKYDNEFAAIEEGLKREKQDLTKAGYSKEQAQIPGFHLFCLHIISIHPSSRINVVLLTGLNFIESIHTPVCHHKSMFF